MRAGAACFGWDFFTRIACAIRRLHWGVLVQSNFGGVLTMGGVPVRKELGKYAYAPSGGDGSCMIVVATDAPIGGQACQQLAARAVFGFGRTGSSCSKGNGDYGVTFSTAPG